MARKTELNASLLDTGRRLVAVPKNQPRHGFGPMATEVGETACLHDKHNALWHSFTSVRLAAAAYFFA